MKKLFIILGLLMIANICSATVINIPSDYSTIQAGINAATEYDTVLVDTGTYVENINFNGKNITVASKFLTTQDTSYISQTIIDGDQNGHVVEFREDENFTAVLIGFTIQNGLAKGCCFEAYGGGIYCDGSNPSIKNLYITLNGAEGGGGIFFNNNNSSCIKNLTITGNAAHWGGGIYFSNSNTHLSNVKITDNHAKYGSGGGVNCYHSSPSLNNVTIINNTSDNHGGGISCSFVSNLKLFNVIISNNSACSYGGGISCGNSSPSLENVTISNNTSYGGGGGIYCTNNSSPSLVNCILWNDSPQEVCFQSDLEPNSITISYSDIEGGEAGIITNNNGTVYWEEGNIDLNPLFVDPTNGDYHLSWTNYPNPDSTMSPCIDAGDPSSPLDPDGTIADIGAYYYNQNQAVDDEHEYITEHGFICFPNPITAKSNEINIKFSLKKSNKVNIKLYNIKGQLVEEILNDNKPIGTHTISSNLNNLSSGIYFIKMDVDGKNRAVKKMVKIE